MNNVLRSIFAYTEDDHSLAAHDEADLIARAQLGDDDATMALLRAYGPAIRSAVASFVNRLPADEQHRTVEDAQMEAVTAVMGIIRDHDLHKSPRLAGRVVQALKAAFGDLGRLDAPFTVPRRTLDRFYGILRRHDGDPEAAAEAAPTYGMTRETFHEILAAVRHTDSLDQRIDGSFVETTPGRTEKTYGEGWGNARPVFTPKPVVDVEDKILVDMAFKAVDDTEARIIELAYGFTEYDPVPDAEIGHRMGMNRLKVLRTRNRALDKMRETLGVTHATDN